MRVLMVSDFYPPVIGGMERHVQTLSRELVRRGHHIAVATLEHKGSPMFEEDEGVRVHRISGWNRVLSLFYQDVERPFHPPVPDPGVMAGLRHVIKQECPDIVHLRRWMLYSFVGLKSWSKAKLVVTMHDYSLICPKLTYFQDGHVCSGPNYRKCLCCSSTQYGKGKALFITSGLALSSRLHGYVDKYIAVSSAVRDACLDGTGNPPKLIEVVPTFIPDNVIDEANSIERPDFLPPTDNYILFVGRQDPSKGLDVLLEAYRDLSDLVPLVVMISEFGHVQKEFPQGVIVVRNAPHDQVMAGWKHCAIGVVPSIWPEPFPQVAIEAMACGKPVVASDVGGISDMILDGQSGILVEPGKVDKLRDALRMLILNPTRRELMGQVGQQRAHLFTVSTVASRIEQIYSELLNGDSSF